MLKSVLHQKTLYAIVTVSLLLNVIFRDFVLISLSLFQSSIQITFDSGLQLAAASAIDSVSCTDQSPHRMVSNLCGPCSLQLYINTGINF